MLHEMKWVMKSIEGKDTSQFNGNIPGDTPVCTWGCFPSIRSAATLAFFSVTL